MLYHDLGFESDRLKDLSCSLPGVSEMLPHPRKPEMLQLSANLGDVLETLKAALSCFPLSDARDDTWELRSVQVIVSGINDEAATASGARYGFHPGRDGPVIVDRQVLGQRTGRWCGRSD